MAHNTFQFPLLSIDSPQAGVPPLLRQTKVLFCCHGHCGRCSINYSRSIKYCYQQPHAASNTAIIMLVCSTLQNAGFAWCIKTKACLVALHRSKHTDTNYLLGNLREGSLKSPSLPFCSILLPHATQNKVHQMKQSRLVDLGDPDRRAPLRLHEFMNQQEDIRK